MNGSAGAGTGDEGRVVPPVILLVCLVAGAYAIWGRPFDAGASYLRVIVLVLSIAGALYAVWLATAAENGTGVRAAVSRALEELRVRAGRSPSVDEAPVTTPPPPEPLLDEVRLERADGRCEFCRKEADGLAVHHVVPRAEGGPNVRRNLVALCPSCLEKAGSGLYSRAELRDRVRAREANYEGR